MADTYIWHDFCGQASGPDLLNIYYTYFGKSTVGDKLLAHNENGELIIDNKKAYQAVLDGSQSSLSFSNGAKLYIYRDQYLHAYLRIKDASITFTFPENRKCKIKYFTNQGPSAGAHSWDSDNGQIPVPASDINFLYEFNHQTSIATNMAYRNNGNSYLKYANFMTDTSSHSDWHSGDASSVGSIDKSNEAVGGWNNIKHYSIPNYYIGQWGNSERGMRRINATGVPAIDRTDDNKFQYKTTPSGLKGNKERAWQFINWNISVLNYWADGGTYKIENNSLWIYNSGSWLEYPINADHTYYKIEVEGSVDVSCSIIGNSITENHWQGIYYFLDGYIKSKTTIQFPSNCFTRKKATTNGWTDFSNQDSELIDLLCTTGVTDVDTSFNGINIKKTTAGAKTYVNKLVISVPVTGWKISTTAEGSVAMNRAYIQFKRSSNSTSYCQPVENGYYASSTLSSMVQIDPHQGEGATAPYAVYSFPYIVSWELQGNWGQNSTSWVYSGYTEFFNQTNILADLCHDYWCCSVAAGVTPNSALKHFVIICINKQES